MKRNTIEVASLFHTKIRELTTHRSEQEKALKETIIRVKGHSIDTAAKSCADRYRRSSAVDGSKKELQDLEKLHISIN